MKQTHTLCCGTATDATSFPAESLHLQTGPCLVTPQGVWRRSIQACWLAVSSLTLSAALGLAAPAVTAPDTNAVAASTSYSVVQRGQDFSLWQRVKYETNRAGLVFARTNQYIELETSKHYFKQGQWHESSDAIELHGNGAVARHAPHQITFSGNINSRTSVEVVTPDSKKLKFRVLGLAFYDYQSGRSVLISELKDSTGELVGTNQVRYPDAFTDIRCDVVYTVKKAGLEQDLVFRERLPVAPEDFSMNPNSTRLLALTEVIDAPKDATTVDHVRRGWKHAAVSKVVDLGAMKIGHGTAFSLGRSANRRDGIPVQKHWVVIEGRTLLMEEVSYPLLRPHLRDLHASLDPAARTSLLAKHSASTNLCLPRVRLADRGSAPASTMRLAALNSLPDSGVALDFDLQTGTSVTLAADQTYVVSGTVNLTDTVIEGGVVVKYNRGARINLLGTVDCQTAPYRPAVLTALDDNNVGEIPEDSSGTPTGTYADCALSLALGGDLRYLRVCFAKEGLFCGNNNLVLKHSQFLDCEVGLHCESSTFSAGNLLMSRVMTNFYGSFFHGRVEHLTSHVANNLVYDWDFQYLDWCESTPPSSMLTLVNSIVAENANLYPDFPYPLTEDQVRNLETAEGWFQTAGAAAYYLPANSSLLDSGTTQIDPDLALALRAKTTCQPVVYSSVIFTTPTILEPCATRDADSAPDLGYHYDPLDYLFDNVQASANLTFAPGTAVGWFSSFDGGHGIDADSNVEIKFDGAYDQPTDFVARNTVQEGLPSQTEYTTRAGIAGSTWPDITEAPHVKAKFLRTSILANSSMAFRDESGFLLTHATDSEFRGGSLGGYISGCELTNCLLDRVFLWLEGGTLGPRVVLRNCTIHGGGLYIHRVIEESCAPACGYHQVVVLDSAFDGTTIQSLDDLATNPEYTHYDYNAFLANSSALYPAGVHDCAVTSFSWLRGRMGRYYLPLASPLINSGSGVAPSIDLQSFTTQLDETPEGASTLDIAYHYPSIPAFNQPTPPTIVTQPTDQTVIVGQGVTFTVVATGSSPLTYRWRKNGVKLPGSTGFSGGTSPSLTITQVQPGDVGTYTVEVSNSAGTAVSTPAVLTACYQTTPPGYVDVPMAFGGYFEYASRLDSYWNFWELNTIKPNFEAPKVIVGYSLDAYSLVCHGEGMEPWINPLWNPILPPACTISAGSSALDSPLYRVGYQKPIEWKVDESGPGFRRLHATHYIESQLSSATATASSFYKFYMPSTINAPTWDEEFGYTIHTRVILRPIERIFTPGSGCQTPPQLPRVEFNPPGALYAPSALSLSVPGHPNAVIYCLITAPNQYFLPEYEPYVGPFAVANNSTVTAYATEPGYVDSPISSATYGDAAPVPDGLVAWWSAEDNIEDRTGRHNGLCALPKIGAPSYAAGKVGRCFSFAQEQRGPAVSIPDCFGLSLNSSMSIECWINPTPGRSGFLLARGDRSGVNNAIKLDYAVKVLAQKTLNDQSLVVFQLGADTQISAPVRAGTWHHCAFVLNQTSAALSLYVDGQRVASRTTSARLSGALGQGAALTVGTQIDGTSSFGGLVDELSIYSRPLETYEILRIWKARSTGKVPLGPSAPTPRVTLQPSDLAVRLGERAAFTVVSEGTGLAYQWYRRDAAGDHPLGTAQSQVIEQTTFNDSGAYRVVVQNSQGMDASYEALLTVDPQPFLEIVTHPKACSALIGDTVTFSVVAEGTAPIHYKWWRTSPNNLVSPLAETSSLLTVPNVGTADNGYRYWVEVSNGAGTRVSYTALLTVAAPLQPSVTTPSDQLVVVGERAKFTVEAVGNPPPHFQWYRVSGGLTEAVGGDSKTLGVLSSDGSNPSDPAYRNVDRAQYYVVAYNSVGTDESDKATLNVMTKTPPAILVQPTGGSAASGSSFEFRVVARSARPITYQWRFKGEDIQDANGSVLSIGSVQPAHAGDYDVVLTHEFGSVTSQKATLTVNQGPTPTLTGPIYLELPLQNQCYNITMKILLENCTPSNVKVFKVDALKSGSLKLDSYVFSEGNCTIDCQTTAYWTPPPQVGATATPAFSVYVSDTVNRSDSVDVYVRQAPKRHLLAWGWNENGVLGNGFIAPSGGVQTAMDGRPVFRWQAANDIIPQDSRWRIYPSTFFTNWSERPVRVLDLDNAVAMRAGYDTVQAVTRDGKLWTWGSGGLFSLGKIVAEVPANGTTPARLWRWASEPQVDGLKAVFLAAPAPIPYETPTSATSGDPKPLMGVRSVSGGPAWQMVLRTDGTLWSWGYSSGGQEGLYGALGRLPDILDDGVTIPDVGAYGVSPRRIHIPGDESDNAATRLSKAVVEAQGTWNAGIARCADNSVWWWGTLGATLPSMGFAPDRWWNSATFGRDNSTTENRWRPIQIAALSTGSPVTQISVDGAHYVVLRNDGTVWEFGYVPQSDPSGAVGHWCLAGNYWPDQDAIEAAHTDTPQQVPLNLPSGENVVSVRAGYCFGLAVTDLGNVYVWGHMVPNFQDFGVRKVTGFPSNTRIVKVAATQQWLLALDTRGYVWAWGSNEADLLGSEAAAARYGNCIETPVPVEGIENVTDIFCADSSMGRFSAFAVGCLEDNKPTGLTAVGIDWKVKLSWNPYPSASQYIVYRSDAEEGAYEAVGTATGNSYKDRFEIENGTTYYYRVTAVVAGGETGKSRAVSVVPTPAPDAPSSLQAVAHCRSISLSWIHPTTGSPRKEYWVYRKEGSGSLIRIATCRADATSYVDQTALEGIPYAYSVQAANAAGPSEYWSLSSQVQIGTGCAAAPVLTTVTTQPADGTANLQWTFTGGASAFRVKYRFGPGCPWVCTDVSAATGDTEGSFILPIQKGRKYWFAVSAIVGGWEGLDSAVVGPRIISEWGDLSTWEGNLAAFPGNQQVYLEWREAPEACEYEVVCKVGDSPTLLSLGTTTGNRFWHCQLSNGTAYHYMVRAYSCDGLSSKETSEADATPLSTLPSGWSTVAFAAEASAYNSMVNIQWHTPTITPPANSTRPLPEERQWLYFLERQGSEPNAQFQLISEVGYGLAFLDKDVVNGKSYTYRVTAIDPDHCRYTTAAVTAQPSQNENLTLLPAKPGNGYVDLTWAPFRATRFIVKHASPSIGGPYETIGILDVSDAHDNAQTSFRHVGAGNNVDHHYYITAISPTGEIQFDSNKQSTRPLPTLAPLPPYPLHGEFVGRGNNGAVELTWTPAKSTAQFEVFLNDGGLLVPLFDAPRAGKSCTYFLPATVVAGTPFTFAIRAVSPNGLASDLIETTVLASSVSPNILQVNLNVAGVPASLWQPDQEVLGPTNLLLAVDTRLPNVRSVSYYARNPNTGEERQLGTVESAPFSMIWYHVPAGTNEVSASVRTCDGSYVSSSSVQTLNTGTVEVRVIVQPELSFYTTAATDLQIPCPGLPITVGRSYSSREVTEVGPLGKGWNASWSTPSVKIGSNLGLGWAEAKSEFLIAISRWCFSDVANHLVTVTLPDGESIDFVPQLDYNPELSPYHYSVDDQPVGMSFVSPYAANISLACDGATDLQVFGTSEDWSGESVTLGSASGFTPSAFTYVAGDRTQYRFAEPGGDDLTWLLTTITDRNGNTLTYSYDTQHRVTKITHSCGRTVEFNYTQTGIEVYDSVAPIASGGRAVLTYDVTSDYLTRVRRLVHRTATPATYDDTIYSYGTTGPAEGRLTRVTDPRGVTILGNTYTDGGKVLNQTNAVGNVTGYLWTDGTLQLTCSNASQTLSATVSHDESGAIAGVASGSQTVDNTYDSRGRLIRQTDANGQSKTYEYDDLDRLVSARDELGNGSVSVFDDSGLVTSSTDVNGATTSYDYDSDGNLTSVTTPSGVGSQLNNTTYEYAHQTSAENQAVKGMLTRETVSPAGLTYRLVTKYKYSTSGCLGDLLQTVQMAVDSSGKALRDSLIIVTDYEYDHNGNRTAETRTRTCADNLTKQVIRTDNTFDAQNRLIETKVTETTGSAQPSVVQHTGTIYDPLGKAACQTNLLTHQQTTFLYDALGNLIETTYPDRLTVSRTAYDAFGRPEWVQDRAVADANTNTVAPATLNVYDSLGRVVRTERHPGVTLAKRHLIPNDSSSPYLVEKTGSSSAVSATRTQYDTLGRVEYTVSAWGAVTKSFYDAAGRVLTNRVYGANHTANPFGTDVLSLDCAGTDTVYTYDAGGNRVTVTDALGHTTTSVYDCANRVVEVHLPATAEHGATKRYTAYDGLGRRVQETDETGLKTDYEYDFLGRLRSVTLDSGHMRDPAAKYRYDELGNLMSQIDAMGRVTTYEYDALGRRTSRTLPGGATETTLYDLVADPDPNPPAGDQIQVQRTTVTDFRQNTIVTRLDRLDRSRVKVVTPYPNGTPTTTTNQYSLDGLLTRIDMFGQVTRTQYCGHDALRRLVRKDTPEGVVAYTYTTNDLVSSVKGYNRAAVPVNGDPSQCVPDADVAYQYDWLARLSQVIDNRVATPNTTTYYYDAVGNLDHFTYPNGVTHAYTYDQRNRLKTLNLTRTDNSLLRRYEYQLAASGQRTGVAESHAPSGTVVPRRAVAYEYDQSHSTPTVTVPQVHRLTGESLYAANGDPAGTFQYIYDLVGNRTSRTVSNVTFDPQSLAFGAQSLAFDDRDLIDRDANTPANPDYDAAGNTIADINGVLTEDVYDVENRLVQRGAGIFITYDHEGNRVRKIANGVTTTNLLDDRNPTGYIQVLAEYPSDSSAHARTYVYGHQLLAQNHTADQYSSWQPLSYYGYDGQGSVRLLVDPPSAATITDTYDYDAYGNLIGTTGTTTNHYRYTGQYWDEDLGMYHLRARYYNPQIGRFWTSDAFEGFQQDPLSLHKYLYCQDNPVNRRDPSGKMSSGEIMVVTGIIGAIQGVVTTAVSKGKHTAGQYLASALSGGILGAATGGLGTWFWEMGAAGRILLGCFGTAAGIANTEIALQNGDPTLAKYHLVTTVVATGLFISGDVLISRINLGRAPKFTAADVEAAISRLQAKGLNPGEFQGYIDPDNVIALAELMERGDFDPALMKDPIIFETTSRSYLSGHHRVVAAEMARKQLPQKDLPVEGTKAGDWSEIRRLPGKRLFNGPKEEQ